MSAYGNRERTIEINKSVKKRERGTETERGFNDPSQEKEGIKRNNQQAEFISHDCK